MRNYFVICALLILALSAGLLRGHGAETNSINRQIDELAAGYLAKRSQGALVVALVQRGNRYSKGFGRDGISGNSPDDRTMFEIGSITKVFTAITLAEMSGDGSVKLDDPISVYLPKGIATPKKNGREITLKTLATHTSGLPRLPDNFFPTVKDQQNPYATYTTQNLYDDLASVQLESEPGKKEAYSNYGFGLLGKVLELKSGKPYGALVEEAICSPLGLTNTTTHLSEAQKRRLAPGHDVQGNVVPNWDSDALAGCGSLCSDAADMLKFVEANLAPAADTKISKALAETRRVHFSESTTSPNSIGLGWQIMKLSDGRTVYWHNGGTGGYISFIGSDRENQVAVVLLANYGDAFASDNSLDQMAWKILKLAVKTPIGP